MKLDFGWFGFGLVLLYYDGPLAFLRVGIVEIDFSNTRLGYWLTMGRWENKYHPEWRKKP